MIFFENTADFPCFGGVFFEIGKGFSEEEVIMIDVCVNLMKSHKRLPYLVTLGSFSG